MGQDYCRLEVYPGEKKANLLPFFSDLSFRPPYCPCRWPLAIHSLDALALPGCEKGRERKETGSREFRSCLELLWAGIGFSWPWQSFKVHSLSRGTLWLVGRSSSPSCPPALITWFLCLVWLVPCGCPLGLWFSGVCHHTGFPCWGLTAPLGGPLWQNPFRRAPD